MSLNAEFISPWNITERVHFPPELQGASFDQNETGDLIEVFTFHINNDKTECSVTAKVEGSNQTITPGSTLKMGESYYIVQGWLVEGKPAETCSQPYPSVCRVTPLVSLGVLYH